MSRMTVLWMIAIASLAAALLAWRQARAAARRLEQLSQMYWELKYQHGELRVQVQRLGTPDAAGAPPGGDAAAGAGVPQGPAERFIPLSSLRR